MSIIEQAMDRVGQQGEVLIINLKPNSQTINIYEIVDVWGFLKTGAPVMFYLRGLFVEEDPKVFDPKDFIRSKAQVSNPIFSVTYLNGTVWSGAIEGKWTTPGPSSTNSVLLWPKTFEYFYGKAKQVMQQIRG